jgi:Zn-dependent alcohol dehydrogenase
MNALMSALVERVRDESDDRGQMAVLTDAGFQRLERAWPNLLRHLAMRHFGPGGADQPTRSRLLVDLYTDARLKLNEHITRRFGLGEINAALRALAAGEVARAVVEIQ